MNKEDLKSILEKVESMGLPDGAYLQFANLMKKEFDSTDDKKIERISSVFEPITFNGLKTIRIKILKQTVYESYKHHPEIYFTVNINGNIHGHTLKHADFSRYIYHMFINNKTISITTPYGKVNITDYMTNLQTLQKLENQVLESENEYVSIEEMLMIALGLHCL